MPYIYAAAVEATRSGIPVMRAMPLEFPRDEACAYLDRQYMLGPSLLVAPVFNAEGDVSYYLPAGRWTGLLDGESIEGGRWVREKHGFMSLPLLVRPNTILPFGAQDSIPDYDYASGLAFHVFEPAEGVEAIASVPDLQGRTVATCRSKLQGKRLSIKVEGSGCTILLRNVREANPASGTAGLRLDSGIAFEARAGEELLVDLDR
jgi:alpha-D-xyloside xylohydrolase